MYLSGSLCSYVLEDAEEAFVKTPDSRPLLLYLRTVDGKDSISGTTRELLERVNNADKNAKIKVSAIIPLENLIINADKKGGRAVQIED